MRAFCLGLEGVDPTFLDDLVGVGMPIGTAKSAGIKTIYRDKTLLGDALAHAKYNPGISDVLLMTIPGGGFSKNGAAAYALELPSMQLPAMPASEDGLTVTWDRAHLSWETTNAFCKDCGLYGGRLPVDVSLAQYHTLTVFDAAGAIAAMCTIKLLSAAAPFSPLGFMPVIYVAIIATRPDLQGFGIAARLYEAAVASCRPPGAPQCAYVCAETVSRGLGWQWWRKRLVRDPLAVLVVSQIVHVLDETCFALGALPCGCLLLPPAGLAR